MNFEDEFPKLKPKVKKKEPLKGNYSQILFADIEKKIGGFENFRFLSLEDMARLIEMNYKYVNEETLDFIALKLLREQLKDDGDNSIQNYKSEEKKINFVEVVINALSK